MGQTWNDLLFAHWRVPVETMRTHVPPELPVDTFDGDAWIGVTPFQLAGLRLIAMPPIPRLSTFLELNVRTYVTVAGKPGILFFSLDAASALAVRAARRFYRLPYFRARMSATRAGTSIGYSSDRIGSAAGRFVFRGRYRPTGEVFQARPASLEYFLTERYCLYTVEDGRVFRGEIHHPPWPLQPAEAEIAANTMPPPGIETSGEPLLHFAGRQDVVIWSLGPA
jgi:uncharacterized protein YqjF (DUF2071 family)